MHWDVELELGAAEPGRVGRKHPAQPGLPDPGPLATAPASKGG